MEAPLLRLLLDLLLPEEALVSSDLAVAMEGWAVVTGTTGCTLAAACCCNVAGRSDPKRWLAVAARQFHFLFVYMHPP